MAKEEEYIFEERSKAKPSKLKSLANFLWNGQTREFCGRDGGSWAKVTFFYAIFYTLLGSFFVGMLAVFYQIMPHDRPTYFGESSVMAFRGVNPGLGFRPQIDVEDKLIAFDPKVVESDTIGYKRYVTNLENFLDAKYKTQENNADVIDCPAGSDNSEQLLAGKSCRFNPDEVFAGTDCTRDNNFGFTSTKPCFLIKLNKIVSWVPEVNATDVLIKCNGDYSGDKDNVHSVTYHSENYINDQESGKIDKKFFPFNAQAGYQAPFVFVQMDISTNTLVKVVCKAYANNIDNEDRMNVRGQTQFSVFIKSDEA